jgi:protein-tyrosine sulfotransferase
MTDALIDSSIRAFIYEIIAQHSKFADVLCDKDPSVWKYAQYISKLFPNAKFLLLIRDARAIIHSIMTRNLTIAGFSLTDYRQNLKSWNNGISIMVSRCKDFGQNQCFMVYYEQLVLQPKKTIESIFKFLNLSMVDSVLPHEELVGKKISFSK